MKQLKQITKNFHRSEFDCKDGTKVPAKYFNNLIKLATNSQVIRDVIDAPITISSGYRTVSHNKKVGGAKHSQHLTASAADFHQSKLNPLVLYCLIELLIEKKEIDEGGVFLYDWGVHYDIRGVKARGNYSSLYKL